MNKCKLAMIALGVISTSALANQPLDFVASDNSAASALCVKIAQGNKHQLRAAVEKIRPNQHIKQNYRFVADKVQCNEMSAVDFALAAENYQNAETLAKYRTEEGNVSIQDIAALRGNVR